MHVHVLLRVLCMHWKAHVLDIPPPDPLNPHILLAWLRSDDDWLRSTREELDGLEHAALKLQLQRVDKAIHIASNVSVIKDRADVLNEFMQTLRKPIPPCDCNAGIALRRGNGQLSSGNQKQHATTA